MFGITLLRCTKKAQTTDHFAMPTCQALATDEMVPDKERISKADRKETSEGLNRAHHAPPGNTIPLSVYSSFRRCNQGSHSISVTLPLLFFGFLSPNQPRLQQTTSRPSIIGRVSTCLFVIPGTMSRCNRHHPLRNFISVPD